MFNPIIKSHRITSVGLFSLGAVNGLVYSPYTLGYISWESIN